MMSPRALTNGSPKLAMGIPQIMRILHKSSLKSIPSENLPPRTPKKTAFGMVISHCNEFSDSKMKLTLFG